MLFRFFSAMIARMSKDEAKTRVAALSDRGYPIGEDNPRTKHSAATVERVRALVAAGASVGAAARAVGVPFNTARAYVYGRRRSEIPSAWAIYRGCKRYVCR